jgi:pimeloyl-ACP methyl ester carboxylesterase
MLRRRDERGLRATSYRVRTLTDDKGAEPVATFVLIHGAGSDGWYWHLVVPELEARGHTALAPDLPCDDDDADFTDYARTVVDAIGDRRDVVLVAQSLAGFTAPLVCEQVPVALLVFVAAMVPKPGEGAGEWWEATHWEEARAGAPMDPVEDFLHDLPDDVRAAATAHAARGQSGTPFERPYPLQAWPAVPSRAIACTQDRFFPIDFMRRVVQERLGIAPDEIDCGHLPALAAPVELAERLDADAGEIIGDVR